MKLHEWLYEMVCQICHDREYVYVCYVRHFGQMMKDIFEQGKTCDSGSYEIAGMKSDSKAILNWRLERCVNLIGLNVVSIRGSIESIRTGKIELQEIRYFELSTGEETIGGLNG